MSILQLCKEQTNIFTGRVDLPSRAWVKLELKEGQLSAYRSENGWKWDNMGSYSKTLDGSFEIGLAVNSGNDSTNTAIFSDMVIDGFNVGTPPDVAPAGSKAYAAWVLEHLPSTDKATARLPDGDPDFDGLSNFLEFAFGGDPMEPVSNEGPTMEMEGKMLKFTYKRARAGIIYEVQTNHSLRSEDWTAEGVIQNSLAAVGETATVIIPLNSAANKSFIRLSVREE